MTFLPLWAFALAFFVLSVFCAETGKWFGRRTARRSPEAHESLSSFVIGAQLGLVSFMVAITFGASMSRLDARRGLVVTEANAIGTAELRSRMLSPPRSQRIRRVLIDYAILRAVEAPAGQIDMAETLERSTRLMSALWLETLGAIEDNQREPPLLAVLVNSVNEVIDTGSRRSYVLLKDRIPLPIWITLLFISLSAFAILGYDQGVRLRRSPGTVSLALALALVLALINDLDRPYAGLSKIHQKPMLDVLEDMQRYDARSAVP